MVLTASPAAAVASVSAQFDASAPSSLNSGQSTNLIINWTCNGTENCENVVITVNTSGSLAGGGNCTINSVAPVTSGQCTVSVNFPSSTPNSASGTATASVSVGNGSGNADTHSMTAISSGTTNTTTTTIGGGGSTTTTSITTTSPPAPTVDVTVVYPDPNGNSYPLPASISNCATVTANSSNGPDSDCARVTAYSPIYGTMFSSASTIGIGQSVEYTLYSANVGYMTSVNTVATNVIPAEFDVTDIYVGSWSPSSHSVEVEFQIGGAWTSLGTFTGNSPAWYAVPSGIEAVRFDYGDMPQQFYSEMHHRIRATALRPNRSGNYYTTPFPTQNCAQWTSDSFSTVTSCRTVNLIQPAARPWPQKFNELTNVGPMEETTYRLRMYNSSSAQLALIDPFMAEHLPYELEYVSWAPITEGQTPTLIEVPDHLQPGRTLLRWEFNRAFPPGQYYDLRLTVRVRMGTPSVTYANTISVSTNNTNHAVECASAASPDTADVDQDRDNSEWLCDGTAYVSVVDRLLTLSRLLVTGEPDLPFLKEDTLLEAAPGECPDFDGYTYFPCVAQTRSLGNTGYRLEVVNQGNVGLSDFVLDNVLRYVDDSYVTQSLAGVTRDSEWRPTLLAPLVVLEAPAGLNVVVEYSYSTNPCRGEMSFAGSGVWPSPCDNDWGPEPTTLNDLQAVQAVRIRSIAGTFDGAESLLVGFDMDAAHGSPFGQETAWTSFGYAATRIDTGGRLQAAEPRATGMVIQQPDNGLGDYIWLDTDRNGVQTAGEPGLNGVEVELWRWNGGTGSFELWLTTWTDFLVGDVTRPGYFFFGDQPPGTYYLQFELPRIGWNVMFPDIGGDDTIDSDGDVTTLRTGNITLVENDIQLDWDQGYFIPGGPFGCDSTEGERTSTDRRHENDPRPCPT
jgi:hypothetical protein